MEMTQDLNETAPLARTMESSPTRNEPELLILLTRSEVNALYELLELIVFVLDELKIEYIVVGRSLLGAVRSESILFNDDDVEIAVIDDGYSYDQLKVAFPDALSREAQRRSDGRMRILYEPQDACDRIKSSEEPRVWLDLFVLRKYDTRDALTRMVKETKIEEQSAEACFKVIESLPDAEFPLFHYGNCHAMALWPRGYFTQSELWPLNPMPFGPLTVFGPSDSVGPLKRCFGPDCFTRFMAAPGSTSESPHGIWEGLQRVALCDIQRHSVEHDRRDDPSQHSWGAHEYTLAECKEEMDPTSEAPLTPSGTIGGMSRTRSVFAFGSGPKTHSSTIQSQGMTLGPAMDPLPAEWFGNDVRRCIGDNPAPEFDATLRAVMEPHIAKARREREMCRNRTSIACDPSIASAVGVPYTALRDERRFLFDPHSYPLHRILAETLGVEDLSQLHSHPTKNKKELLAPLLTRDGRRQFHECYFNFVTSFCIPLLHSLAWTKGVLQSTSLTLASDVKYRFQVFPCLRVILPGELSIDPHCETAHGHSIGNLNFHVPLTAAFGTNALYTESHPGREDWHGLTTKSPGLGFLFDGARCLHFRLQNTTNVTRVSIDFRVAIYREGADAGDLCSQEFLADRFSSAGPGYYDETSIAIGLHSSFPGDVHSKDGGRKRLIDPDARVGFPFTE